MRVEVNGTTLFFDAEGSNLTAEARARPTLLLVHGGPGFDHSSFKPGFSRLAGVARVIYLDLRGQGRSDPDVPENWTIDQWADDIKAFCDLLSIEKPIVLGQSFGGFVTMAYATRFPEHPGGLILSSTAAHTDYDRKFAAFERVGGPEARRLAEGYWLNPTPETAAPYMEKCMPLYWRRSHDLEAILGRVLFRVEVALHFAAVSKEMTTYDFRPALDRIVCPTLITVGDMDPITPVGDSEEIFAHLRKGVGRLEIFRDCGHGVELDCPRQAYALMREFIASV